MGKERNCVPKPYGLNYLFQQVGYDCYRGI